MTIMIKKFIGIFLICLEPFITNTGIFKIREKDKSHRRVAKKRNELSSLLFC